MFASLRCSNSIKFTPPGGSIYVSARQSLPLTDSPAHPPSPAKITAPPDDASWVQRAHNWLQRKESGGTETPQSEGMLRFEIEVNDTGCGLSPEKRETVFETFTQADSSTTRMYGESQIQVFSSQSFERQAGVSSFAYFESRGEARCLSN